MNTCPRKPYVTDLTDEQGALVEPILLAFEDRVRPGPERGVDSREVVNTLLYQNRTGCQGRLLPHDLLPKSTVYDSFAKWRDHEVWSKIVAALREQIREQAPQKESEAMRAATPSAACSDSQTVKTTERGGRMATTAPRRSRGASVTWWWIPWACCWPSW